MLDRRFYSEARATRRYRLQQEAVDLAAVDQVHEHLTVVTTARDDRNEPGRALAQVLRELFDLVADHRGVDNSDTDLVLANALVRLLECIGVMDIVHATRRFLDRRQKFLVFRQYEHID